MTGYLYILECADGTFYTGSTNNLELRLAQHQSGEGANHTKKRLPVKLVYLEIFPRIDEAFYREKQVQGWSHAKKKALIDAKKEGLVESSKNYSQYPRLIGVASTGSATGFISKSGETSGLVPELASQPVTEKLPEPVIERSLELATEQTHKPATERNQKPVTERIQKPVTERIQKPVTERIQKPVTEPVEVTCQRNFTQPFSPPIHIPILLGPTAAGKTALAISIAERHGWEIISCDSRQVYRHMNIGTAKPTAGELARVPHHLVNCIDPDVPYSVYAYVNDAIAAIRDLARNGRTGLVCGGTGLYCEGLRYGIGRQVESDPLVRDRLMKRVAKEGNAVLHAELREKDPESAEKIHSNDVHRTVRALAVLYQTGTKFSSLQSRTPPPANFVFKAAVVVPMREPLYERINARVERMVADGLLDEFRSLRERGYDENSPGMRCVGYRELFAVERGECSFKEAVENIKRNTRRYAKRQITWFGAHNRDEIVDYCDNAAALETRIEKAIAFS